MMCYAPAMTEPSDPTVAKSAAAARLAELVKRKRAAGQAHGALNGKGTQSEQAAASRSASKSKPALRK
jgi:hypothetical protein